LEAPVCRIDLGNTVLVCTNISGADTSNLTILTKQTASYSTADLVGNWEGSLLSSGPSPWWVAMSNTIYLDGAYTGIITSSNGSSAGASGQISISKNGVMSCLSGDCPGRPSNYKAFMASNKSVSVGTGVAAQGLDVLLSVAARQAASYSMDDLAGTWRGNSLASGPGAPYWERDLLTIDADGAFTASWIASDGSSGAERGVLSISQDGVITCVSGDCADRTFMSFMDAGKTVAAGTRTWPDGATREIEIFTKESARVEAMGANESGPMPVSSNGATLHPTGSLKVTITPAAAVSAGAKWNVDKGTWQKSGATVGKLSVGNHHVYFNTIKGWTSPPSQTTKIVKNKTTPATGKYIQAFGSLMVTIGPDSANMAGAMWNVDGGQWYYSGDTVNKLSVGAHKVNFYKKLSQGLNEGYAFPPSQTVNIVANKTVTATGFYGHVWFYDSGCSGNPPVGKSCPPPYQDTFYVSAHICGEQGATAGFGFTVKNFSNTGVPVISCGPWEASKSPETICTRKAGEPECTILRVDFLGADGDDACDPATFSWWAEIKEPTGESTGQVSMPTLCCANAGSCPQ